MNDPTDDPVVRWLLENPKARKRIAEAYERGPSAEPVPLGDDDEVEVSVICMPTTAPPLTPAVQKSCADCGQPVWLSLATIRRLAVEAAGRAALILCGPCGIARIGEDDEIMPPSTEEFRAIAERGQN